jgi:hypothetical protein
MAGIYSTCFLDSAGAPPPSNYEYTVPEGFVVVVRNITFTFWGRGYPGLFGGNVLNVYSQLTNTSIWALSPGTIQNRTYFWEGREVFVFGDGVTVSTDIAQCSYRVNGFLLVAP